MWDYVIFYGILIFLLGCILNNKKQKTFPPTTKQKQSTLKSFITFTAKYAFFPSWPV